MPYAVTLRLDPVAGARVAALWTALARDGLTAMLERGYAPHITLAVLHDGTASVVEPEARAAAGWHGRPLRFAGFGVFPGPPAVLWLAPVPDPGLLGLQRELCNALPAAQLHPHYRPGAWVPHATLAEDLTLSGLAEALASVSDGWSPFAGTLEQVDLVRFRPVSVLWQMRLPAPPT